MTAHGTPRGYNTGCRCTDCKAAHARRMRNHRRAVAYGRHQPPTVPLNGTRLRLQALQRVGWSLAAISRMLGWHPDRLNSMLRTNYGGTVSRANARLIADVYDQLWDRPPPERTKNERMAARHTRTHALRSGYAAPMELDDDRIDDPTYEPERVTRAGSWDLKTCGTPAAARRHYRRGERLDAACRAADTRERRERKRAA